MPILSHQPDLFPGDLLDRAGAAGQTAEQWWALYTLSRQEKRLMRQLKALNVPFYCPTILKRNRSPAGRVRSSQLPLFTNYVFVFGDDAQRQLALTTNTVSRSIVVPDRRAFTADLRQIQRLVATGAPLTPEARLEPGMYVRVKSGAFRDFEGRVIRREGETRLLVYVNFLQQGASVLLDDCQLERLN